MTPLTLDRLPKEVREVMEAAIAQRVAYVAVIPGGDGRRTHNLWIMACCRTEDAALHLLEAMAEQPEKGEGDATR